MKLIPRELVSEDGELIDVIFDLTLVITKNNVLTVVDNTQDDVNDIIDCATFIAKTVKISIP